MATWSDLSRYVHRKYKVDSETETSMTLLYATTDERSQLIVLWRQVLLDEEWVEIESPIARIQDVDAVNALRLAGELVCGGLVVSGETLTLRHSAPLKNLDTNEFEQPLTALVVTADLLEKELTGRDDF